MFLFLIGCLTVVYARGDDVIMPSIQETKGMGKTLGSSTYGVGS